MLIVSGKVFKGSLHLAMLLQVDLKDKWRNMCKADVSLEDIGAGDGYLDGPHGATGAADGHEGVDAPGEDAAATADGEPMTCWPMRTARAARSCRADACLHCAHFEGFMLVCAGAAGDAGASDADADADGGGDTEPATNADGDDAAGDDAAEGGAADAGDAAADGMDAANGEGDAAAAADAAVPQVQE